jgi:hypothetical protein
VPAKVALITLSSMRALFHAEASQAHGENSLFRQNGTAHL